MLNKLNIPVPLWTGKIFINWPSVLCAFELLKWYRSTLCVIFMSPLEKGWYIALLLSVSRLLGLPIVSVPQMSHILKWNLVSRYIIRISFWYDRTIFERVMFLGLRKIPVIFAVSIHFLHKGCTSEMKFVSRFIIKISRSSYVLANGYG